MRSVVTVLKSLLFAWTLSLPSCVLMPGYGGPPPKAQGSETPPSIPWKDLRGVIHCHSRLSHDSPGMPEEIADAANRVELDFLIMTDHYTERGVLEAMRGFHGRTLFLPGAEMRKDRRYALALGIERPIDRSQSWREIHEQVTAQGGLLFLGHLEKYGEEIEDFSFDGLEIFNLHAAADLANPFALFLRGLFFPPGLVFPSLARLHEPNLRHWEKALRARPVPIVAGNDAHNNLRLFGPLGGVVGNYEQLFRTVTTHVWARENSREAILDALRAGRSYVAFEHLADATGFWVEAREEAGRTLCRIFAPESANIRLVRNGVAIAEAEGQWLQAALEPSWEAFRVEVFLRGKIWILAGPFYSPPRDEAGKIGP